MIVIIAPIFHNIVTIKQLVIFSFNFAFKNVNYAEKFVHFKNQNFKILTWISKARSMQTLSTYKYTLEQGCQTDFYYIKLIKILKGPVVAECLDKATN